MRSRYPNKKRNCLTAAFVRHAAPGKYYDADGLYLRVDESGAARWAWRGTVHSKRVDLGLGSTRHLTLSGARQKAFEYRKLARAGGDPRALRPDRAVPTFAEAAETVIGIHEPGWKDGGKTAAQWRSSLRDYVMKRLGKRRVSEIDTVDVMAVLLSIWTTKAATARKVRQRIGAVMRWSVAQGYRSDNPAGDAIGTALPKANGIKKHYRALPHSEVAGAIAIIRASRAHWATIAAIEFLTLTAARSGEVRHARWPQVDIKSATWTVPTERAKTGREHRVPLSRPALQVLAEARRATGDTSLIFPSVTGRALSDNTLSKLLRENGIPAVIHGMRSSFRDWCAESGISREVAEACLAHVVQGVEGSYFRSDLFERRRASMQLWADYLSEGGLNGSGRR